MERRMVDLWDVADDRMVGTGFVEYLESYTDMCVHKWVLDRGYRFRASGLSYRPRSGQVSLESAEKALSDRWGADSRLVVCEAQGLTMPQETNSSPVESAEPRFKGAERIELRGVWETETRAGVAGYVLVPDVSWYAAGDAKIDSRRLSTSLLAGRSATLRKQNDYVEHWVFQDQPFALLSADVQVAAPSGAAPAMETFFEDMTSRMRERGSYTRVTCATWVYQEG